MEAYLEWRCRTSWHPKYYKYIQEWIDHITDEQLAYFKKEKENLINKGIYEITHRLKAK